MLSIIKHARGRIETLRLALVSPEPEEIDAALSGVEEAARCLEDVEREIRGGAFAPYEVRRELELLKNDLLIVGRLIEHGVAFCQKWAKMLGGCPAYTPSGETVPSRPEGTFLVRG
jgi:hypothetical protein